MTLSERIAVLQRVADALAAVRSALAPLSADDRRAVLADVVAELDAQPPAVPAPPPPPKRVPAGNDTPRPKREPTAGADDTRRKLLKLLAENPDGLKVSELSEMAGVGDNIVSYNLKHEWFEKSDPSYVRSPWVLTEAGESAAEKLSRATAPAT